MPTQMERIRWEGQNFFEVVAPQEEEEAVRYKYIAQSYQTFVFMLWWDEG
jgi:hypothetical protein